MFGGGGSQTVKQIYRLRSGSRLMEEMRKGPGEIAQQLYSTCDKSAMLRVCSQAVVGGATVAIAGI